MSVEQLSRSQIWQVTEKTVNDLKDHESGIFSAINKVKTFNHRAYILNDTETTLVSATPLEINTNILLEQYTNWLTFSGINKFEHHLLSGLNHDDHPQYPEVSSTETITGNWNFTQNIKTSGSIQVGYDSSIANSTNVGSFRYRTSGNNSYIEACVQTSGSIYEWKQIGSWNWI